MKALVIAEHDNHVLKSSTRCLVSGAQSLADEIHCLIIGYQCDAVLLETKKIEGIHTIKVADARVYEHQLAENSASLIQTLAQEYGAILAPANTFGKNLLPRVSALLNMTMVSDVIQIKSSDLFVRPLYAGNATAEIKLAEPIKLLTLRPTAFTAMPYKDNPTVTIEKITTEITNECTQWVDQTITPLTRPELSTARIVVSGGRGLKSAEQFKLIEALADQLGAAVGASRAAVDAGFVSNDFQVGQTGKIVAPELYIAVGISGAVQHLAGMKESKIVVAINQDADAPIFNHADYGLVADLFKALPELQALLEKPA